MAKRYGMFVNILLGVVLILGLTGFVLELIRICQ